MKIFLNRKGNFCKIKTLWLNSNKISHIKGFESLINLETLYLSNNRIKKINRSFHKF